MKFQTKVKKPLSLLLSVLMFISVFTAVPLTVGAIDADSSATHYLRPYQTERMYVYNGDLEKSFVMMGAKFTRGLVTNNGYNNSSSHAEFNLNSKVSSVSFVVGHIDGDENRNGELKIYLDGVIQESYTKTLTPGMINQTVTINVAGKMHMEIHVSGDYARYGIGNIIETGAHNYECAITKVSTAKDDGKLTYTCIDCGDSYTETDPAKEYCTNYILPYQTNSMIEWKESFGSSKNVSVMGNKYYRALSSNAYDNANAFYSLNSAYSAVAFRVGHKDNDENGRNGTLNVYLDGTLVRTVALTPIMMVQDISLNTTNVTQLKIEITGNYARYVVFDINATPVIQVNKTHSYVEETLVEAAFRVKGTIRHVCSVCGAYYTTSSPALTRSLKDGNARLNIDTTSYTYNGKSKSPKVTVRYGYEDLVKNVDYTVKYKNNKNPGIASVTVTGKNGYKGSLTATFTIYPKKATLSYVKSKKKNQITVKWKKDSTVTGYEVQYSTSSYFWYTTTKTVKKATSKNLTGLTRKATYYVRVRSYKTIGGTKYYGAYSNIKNAKVK